LKVVQIDDNKLYVCVTVYDMLYFRRWNNRI